MAGWFNKPSRGGGGDVAVCRQRCLAQVLQLSQQSQQLQAAATQREQIHSSGGITQLNGAAQHAPVSTVQLSLQPARNHSSEVAQLEGATQQQPASRKRLGETRRDELVADAVPPPAAQRVATFEVAPCAKTPPAASIVPPPPARVNRAQSTGLPIKAPPPPPPTSRPRARPDLAPPPPKRVENEVSCGDVLVARPKEPPPRTGPPPPKGGPPPIRVPTSSGASAPLPSEPLSVGQSPGGAAPLHRRHDIPPAPPGAGGAPHLLIPAARQGEPPPPPPPDTSPPDDVSLPYTPPRIEAATCRGMGSWAVPASNWATGGGSTTNVSAGRAYTTVTTVSNNGVRYGDRGEPSDYRLQLQQKQRQQLQAQDGNIPPEPPTSLVVNGHENHDSYGTTFSAAVSTSDIALLPDTNGDQILRCTGACGKAWTRWEDVPHWSKNRPKKPWCDECGSDMPGPWNSWIPTPQCWAD